MASIPVWKKAPFLRLLVPLICGILLQWHFQYQREHLLIAFLCFSTAVILFQLLPLSFRFSNTALQGILINLVIAAAGMLLTYQKDVRHHADWFGNLYHDSDYLVLTINEPLQQKEKSFKAEALVKNIVTDAGIKAVTGKVVMYLAREFDSISLQYGDQIIIGKKVQAIPASGNPGAFDYRRYAAFKQIFHTVYLKKGEWVALPHTDASPFNRFLFTARQHILDILHRNLSTRDDQLSIAEALLIGYTQDLDRDLVQAYSNTGVVHIIAISGMHLGLIYLILLWLFKKIPYVKKSGFTKSVLILMCLWLFALLTGGGASILRSAVMFSFIVTGENFSKKISIYNSLAASAFFLLCFNPYYLWDMGFQLSYLALSGIVIFQKPIYHLLFIRPGLPDKIWQLAAVSLAAQVFTFPVCIYYFHQFPVLFLIANLITVPLSSLILLVEIFLVAFAWVPGVGMISGKLAWLLIWLMNRIIMYFNGLRYALWAGIPATVTSTVLLYAVIISAGAWLLYKNKWLVKICLGALLVFAGTHALSKWDIANQKKIIVYNIPQHQAVDFIDGKRHLLVADSMLAADRGLQSFHIKPAGVEMQLETPSGHLQQLFRQKQFYQFRDIKIILIDSAFDFEPVDERIPVNFIIISRNAPLKIAKVAATFNCDRYIFDASNSLWKIEKWKQECQSLHLPFYSVPERGAFIADL